MERSSSGQEPTRLPRWEEVARRESSEDRRNPAQVRLRTENSISLFWNFAWDRLVSHCYSVPYMKIPAKNQVIIIRSDYQCQKWYPCKRSRSKVKVTEVKTQLSRFQTVTPVWIHGWLWNDAQSFRWHRRGAPLFFKITHQISRPHGMKNPRFWPKFGISGL